MESLQLQLSLNDVQVWSPSRLSRVCLFLYSGFLHPQPHTRGRPIDPRLLLKAGKVIVFIFLDTLCAFQCATQRNCEAPHQWLGLRHQRFGPKRTIFTPRSMLAVDTVTTDLLLGS